MVLIILESTKLIRFRNFVKKLLKKIFLRRYRVLLFKKDGEGAYWHMLIPCSALIISESKTMVTRKVNHKNKNSKKLYIKLKSTSLYVLRKHDSDYK